MEPTKLYAEIQANPKSRAAYRKLAEYYKSCNQSNISEAFLYLLERKFHVPDGADSHEEQRTESTDGD